ncbi:hypothetical protein N658DRAFT_487118 [Parathielavia hyrcaniae]|uniref:CENP-V/GFA domain-containing protein n=1 Tax=Parathielavia hyrcaniae TaxID=113614 RepID=A0AAN6Q0S1_9PEZI|nr:hypothetical protein N658DRAFT_487118 [Parathielavia hyrcaniae]
MPLLFPNLHRHRPDHLPPAQGLLLPLHLVPVLFEDHVSVRDTLDWGAACWLRGVNGPGQPEARAWLGGNNWSEEGGSELFNWTFAWLKHTSFSGDQGDDGLPVNTAQLRAAVEAADFQRYFCERCSASVFYAVDDRPDWVDIAVGLLESPDGARAESVILWSFGGMTGWEGDMVGTWRERMLHAVEKEVEQWRVERGYPMSWYRLKKQQAQQAAQEPPEGS